MKKKLIQFSFIVVFLGLLLVCPDFGFSEEIDGEIKVLNDKISESKSKIEEIQRKQEEYNQIISQKRQEKNTLANQLAIINTGIAKAELEIEGLELQIDEINLEIRKINVDIRNKENKIETEKNHMAELIKMVYKNDQASILEILLLNNSLNDFLDQMQYLENTNEEISNSLNSLRSDKETLEENRTSLEAKSQELLTLKNDLDDSKEDLEYEKNNKAFVLERTHESEKQYQSLLSTAIKEQKQAEAEITALEEKIREKLEANKQLQNAEPTDFIWPVKKNTVTASFHDPDYPYRSLLGEHSGVDIRASQGTTLKAAAAGYVARVKYDGTRAYAYIMIIHDNGLSSVYGHVSAVNVEADQFVAQGQIIGKTGGMPGGIGSGSFSSGPHLHFEIRKDGLPVNPAAYLP
jgi:murein DD-endopeptidase MepM/ murein hydrolase activator NlpD